MSVTKEEFIDAIEKNNYEQTHGILFDVQEGKILACAAGQGLLNSNLITEEEVLAEGEGEARLTSIKGIDTIRALFGSQFYYDIWQLNDREHLTCKKIAERLRKYESNV